MKIARLSAPLLASLFPTPSPAAESYRVSAAAGSSGIYQLEITPDASRAVYTEGNLNIELWSAPLAPDGTAIKLSTGLIPGGQVALISWSLSPDGTKACYLAEGSAPGVFELFSVPVTGGPPVRISPGFSAGGVQEFPRPAITPDGNRVV